MQEIGAAADIQIVVNTLDDDGGCPIEAQLVSGSVSVHRVTDASKRKKGTMGDDEEAVAKTGIREVKSDESSRIKGRSGHANGRR